MCSTAHGADVAQAIMHGDAVVLYHGRASTCSKKVRLALYEKGIVFTSRLIDLQKFEQHEASYLALNPNGVVPTLVHGGLPVVESSVIIEYIEDAFPGPALAPPDAHGRARMRLWLRFSDEVAYKAVYAPTWQLMRQRAAEKLGDDELASTLSRIPTAERRDRWLQMAKGGYSEEELEDATDKMVIVLDRLEAQLTRTSWLLGEIFSLADVAVLPFADRIRNLRPDFLEGPNRTGINEWLRRAAERPSFGRALVFTEDPRAAELPNI